MVGSVKIWGIAKWRKGGIEDNCIPQIMLVHLMSQVLIKGAILLKL
jgi:hypothetical protein